MDILHLRLIDPASSGDPTTTRRLRHGSACAPAARAGRATSPASCSRLLRMTRPLALVVCCWLSVAGSLLDGGVRADQLPTCQPKDFHYEFTDCDERGGRWRVSVPTPGICTGGAPNAPIRIDKCNTACDAGTYFNVSTLVCDKCPAGSYSLGGGVFYDSWETVPTGFHVIVENLQSSFRALLPHLRGYNLMVNCSGFGWRPYGDFIASPAAPCTSVLTYSVKLVKPGRIMYTYQYLDDTVIFQFQVQNEQCQSIEEAEQSRWPPITDEGKWRTQSVPLKTGLNVLEWKTIGMTSEGYRRSQTVLIKNIEISGLAYTSSCVPCRNGTNSSVGSSECSECPFNTYSDRGAEICDACPPKQYAPKGSSKCLPQLPCEEKDYYLVHSPCDKYKKTQQIHKWFEPKICDDNVDGAASLPSPRMKVDCMPCNPGMYYTERSWCAFCPDNHYSNGHHDCQPCPSTTAPNYGYQFLSWHDMPPGMEASCMSLSEKGCRTSDGWQTAGDHIHSGIGHTEDAYLLLGLKVPGFRSAGGIVGGRAVSVGKISFEFELDCSSSCEFIFMQESETRGTSVLQSWNRTAPNTRMRFSYDVTQNDTYMYSWAFQKFGLPALNASSNKHYSGDNDHAKIFSINVTNTIDGGASACFPCPRGFGKDGCIPCPSGHYVDVNSTTCKQCPANTFVSDIFPYGLESCKPCGLGLKSDNGQSCYSDCRLITNGRQYDFSSLAGFHQVQGSRQFTASGTEYFHLFNISLCGEHGQGTTVCSNNITSRGLENETSDSIRSTVCRSTVIPMRGAEGTGNLAAQSIKRYACIRWSAQADEPYGQCDHCVGICNLSHCCTSKCPSCVPLDMLASYGSGTRYMYELLGDHLIGVTTESSISTITVVREFLQKDLRFPDIHFFYSSPVKTRSCPTGRSAIVTLRCDVSQPENGTIALPPTCPDGTCDGCSFHFLWLSRRACPTCTTDDYEVVTGECSHGVQTIHYIAPKNCLLPKGLEKLENKKRHCSSIPEELQLVIGFSALLGFLLLILVIYFWKKNRKLAYKYMKLVQSASTKEGELPPAESCALHDDEEDQFDSVQFRESKGKLLLSKLRSMAGTKDGSKQPFESLHLTEKDDPT